MPRVELMKSTPEQRASRKLKRRFSGLRKLKALATKRLIKAQKENK